MGFYRDQGAHISPQPSGLTLWASLRLNREWQIRYTILNIFVSYNSLFFTANCIHLFFFHNVFHISWLYFLRIFCLFVLPLKKSIKVYIYNIYKCAYEFKNYNVRLSWLLYSVFFTMETASALSSSWLHFTSDFDDGTLHVAVRWCAIGWGVYRNYFMTMCGAISQYAKIVIYGENTLFSKFLL